jgi:zona occludens toxin (predicted ATPase)
MKIYHVFYHDETDTPYRYTERGLDKLYMRERKWKSAVLPNPEYVRSLKIEDLPAHIVRVAKRDFDITMTLEEARKLAAQPMSDE